MISMTKSKDWFLQSSTRWVCDNYSLLIIYVILKDTAGKPWLADALVTVGPVPFAETFDFHIEAAGITIGHVVRNLISKDEINSVLEKAAQGTIRVHGIEYCLNVSDRIDFYTEMDQHERWFADLHLQVIGTRPTSVIDIDFMAIDNQLRQSNPPFDGFGDVVAWLGLHTLRSTDRQPSIQLRVGPPVDLLIDRSDLANNELNLVLRAHPNLDIKQVGLALRSVPGVGLQSRQQAASLIEWSDAELNSREGRATVPLENCDNVLAIVMLGSQTVRRQWILDPAKAGNTRFIATQVYDNDLKRLSKVLFESTDSREFEKGIASLAFLLGFSPALQVESDAPDLLLTTPYGRIALIECTLKIADFATKLGKLVERQQAMKKAFESIQHYVRIYGILVCALPKDRIRYDASELERSGITLVTQEHLTEALGRLRHPPHPDKIFEDIDARSAVSATKILQP
jgi:hypothetical protein